MGVIQGGKVIEGALARPVQEVSFEIGREASDVINVAIEMRVGGQAVNERARGEFYLSDDANGDSLTATAPSGGLAIGTNGVILSEHSSGKHFTAISEADGSIDINIRHAGAKTWRLVAVMNDGRITPSAAIRFA